MTLHLPTSDCHHVGDTGVKNLKGKAKHYREGKIVCGFQHNYLSGKLVSSISWIVIATARLTSNERVFGILQLYIGDSLMQILLGHTKRYRGVLGVMCIVFLLLLLSQHDKGGNMSHFPS